MSHHLHRLLSQEVVHQHPNNWKEGGDRHAFNMDMAMVGMSCHFPGGVASPSTFGEFLHAGIIHHHTSHLINGMYLALLQDQTSARRQKCKSCMVRCARDRILSSFRLQYFKRRGRINVNVPLQRILLECLYVAMLDVGYTLNETKGLNCRFLWV